MSENTIPKYIHDWLEIIENMNNDNTYKLAWGCSIVQCCQLNQYFINDNHVIISFESIAENILKYYWNQTFFFNLQQGPNDDKPPEIYTITKEVIDKYCTLVQSKIPVWFNIGSEEIKKDKIYYSKVIKKISTALTRDVCWRFVRIGKNEINIYKLDIAKREITITIDNLGLIKEYSLILSQLLNYKWSQLLEKFNRSPKISSKVKGASEAKIRRSNLSRYKELLLKQFNNGEIHDFYTGELLSLEDIDVDHVIPWSFMYSDDIWNLVLTSKSYNRSKSNSVPSEEVISKLKTRNLELLNRINDNRYKNQLQIANEKDYAKLFWLDLKHGL